jgi:Peptidase family M28
VKRSNWVLPWLATAVVGRPGSTNAPDWDALGRRWWSHVQVLADDNMEGRETGSLGYARAAEYVIRQFHDAGLQPAGEDGYRQPVDFQVTQLDPAHCSLDLLRNGEARPVHLGDEAEIIATSATAERAEADAVFVGYGLEIPELHYSDLADQDVRGKIAVYVSGGPSDMPGPIKAHYQSPHERVRSLRKAGAAGLVVLPNPTAADLPWPRVVIGLRMARMELRDPGPAGYRPLPVTMMFNPERAEALFADSGHTFQEIVSGLGTNRPLPRFPLAVKVRVHVGFSRREAKCTNVVAVLPGTDPKLKNEYVVISAHLDHLGIGEPINGDPIYNGAMDNASGVASMLEIARGIKESGATTRRSLLFLAVTGEEKFLLGSEYFATHPTVTGPLVANINIDGNLPLYPLKFLEVQGLGESSLGEDMRAVAAEEGVEVHAEYEPDRVLFIRSDQYNFIKQGVPALFSMFGYLRGSPEEQMNKDWSKERYHGPKDDLDQPVDPAAAARFNRIHEKLVLRVANADRRPTWNPESFFNRFVR